MKAQEKSRHRAGPLAILLIKALRMAAGFLFMHVECDTFRRKYHKRWGPHEGKAHPTILTILTIFQLKNVKINKNFHFFSKKMLKTSIKRISKFVQCGERGVIRVVIREQAVSRGLSTSDCFYRKEIVKILGVWGPFKGT